MSERLRLHAVVEALPPEQVSALSTLLAPTSDLRGEPFLRALRVAPVEDVDHATAEEFREALRDLEINGTISHAELERTLGAR